MGLLIYSISILGLLFIADKFNDYWSVESDLKDVTIVFRR